MKTIESVWIEFEWEDRVLRFAKRYKLPYMTANGHVKIWFQTQPHLADRAAEQYKVVRKGTYHVVAEDTV